MKRQPGQVLAGAKHAVPKSGRTSVKKANEVKERPRAGERWAHMQNAKAATEVLTILSAFITGHARIATSRTAHRVDEWRSARQADKMATPMR